VVYVDATEALANQVAAALERRGYALQSVH
jgi:hypothetical protein